MDKRLLERIIILILLLLNLFLLAMVLSDSAQSQSNLADMTESLVVLLEESGISADKGVVSVQPALPALTLTRDPQQEADWIDALMGDSSCQDLGGNILFYRSGIGQAEMRGSGEIDVLFSGDSSDLRGKADTVAHRLMKRCGTEISLIPTEDGERLSCYCCLNGSPVYNAILHFDFEGERLYLLSGTRLFDSVTKSSAEGIMDSASALLRFVEIVKNEGYICSALKSVSCGYLMSVSVSGESVLTPVWRMETDTGVLLISGETGKVMPQS